MRDSNISTFASLWSCLYRLLSRWHYVANCGIQVSGAVASWNWMLVMNVEFLLCEIKLNILLVWRSEQGKRTGRPMVQTPHLLPIARVNKRGWQAFLPNLKSPRRRHRTNLLKRRCKWTTTKEAKRLWTKANPIPIHLSRSSFWTRRIQSHLMPKLLSVGSL